MFHFLCIHPANPFLANYFRSINLSCDAVYRLLHRLSSLPIWYKIVGRLACKSQFFSWFNPLNYSSNMQVKSQWQSSSLSFVCLKFVWIILMFDCIIQFIIFAALLAAAAATYSAPVYNAPAPVYSTSPPAYSEPVYTTTYSAPVYSTSSSSYSAPEYSTSSSSYSDPEYTTEEYVRVEFSQRFSV